MNYRKVRIYTGEVFHVPSHINRLDSPKNRAWQIRYGRSTLKSTFSDSEYGGPQHALHAATKGLLKRVMKVQAPTGLKTDTVERKSSKLPLGISGPCESLRKGRKVKQYDLQVSLPRFGDKSKNARVYIGTENTISQERINNAVGKAQHLRQEAERKYQQEATKAMRKKHEDVVVA